MRLNQWKYAQRKNGISPHERNHSTIWVPFFITQGHRESPRMTYHLRENMNIKDDNYTALTNSFWQGEYDRDDNDCQMIIGEPWGPESSWHLSYRWGKTRTGIEPGPAAWQASMLPPAPQRCTDVEYTVEKINVEISKFSQSQSQCPLISEWRQTVRNTVVEINK